MGNYIIGKERILEFLPEYLQNNEDFLTMMASLLPEKANVELCKTNNDGGKYYLFRIGYQDNEKDKNYSTFSLSISKKGTVVMTGGMTSTVERNGKKINLENAQSIYVLKEKNGDYSISNRSISRFPSYGSFALEEGEEKVSQFLEKRNYDSDGILRKSTVRCYSVDDDTMGEYLEWNQDADCVKESTYYYFDTNDLLSSVKVYLPSRSEEYSLTSFEDDKLTERKKISKEEFEGYVTKFYNDKLKRIEEIVKINKKKRS